jgi:hypothetical protein
MAVMTKATTRSMASRTMTMAEAEVLRTVPTRRSKTTTDPAPAALAEAPLVEEADRCREDVVVHHPLVLAVAFPVVAQAPSSAQAARILQVRRRNDQIACDIQANTLRQPIAATLWRAQTNETSEAPFLFSPARLEHQI